MCNYCGIPSHERAVCRHRMRDIKNGLIRSSHPARGNIPSGNQARKEIQSKIASLADQWGDQWIQPHVPLPRRQGPQWPAAMNNSPAPMTVTVTDPEDQKWLAQATSSGLDPASVITSCRQRQQQFSRSQNTEDNNRIPTHTPQTPQKVSSILPSGLVACHECAHVSATFELADAHYQANHLGLASRPDRRN